MLSLTLDCQKIFIGSALELIKKNISKEYRVLIGGVVEVESLIPEHILSHNRNSTFGCNSRIEYRRVTKKCFVCIISPSLTTTSKETLSFPLLKVREFTSKVTGLVQGKASIQTRSDWLASLLFELLHHPLPTSSSEMCLWLFPLFSFLPKLFWLLGLSISTSPSIDGWFLMRKVIFWGWILEWSQQMLNQQPML